MPVIQVVPITAWREKKARIKTNVELMPAETNGLTKKSIADCLQTRTIDQRQRLVRIRGRLEGDDLARIDAALRIVFDMA